MRLVTSGSLIVLRNLQDINEISFCHECRTWGLQTLPLRNSELHREFNWSGRALHPGTEQIKLQKTLPKKVGNWNRRKENPIDELRNHQLQIWYVGSKQSRQEKNPMETGQKMQSVSFSAHLPLSRSTRASSASFLEICPDSREELHAITTKHHGTWSSARVWASACRSQAAARKAMHQAKPVDSMSTSVRIDVLRFYYKTEKLQLDYVEKCRPYSNKMWHNMWYKMSIPWISWSVFSAMLSLVPLWIKVHSTAGRSVELCRPLTNVAVAQGGKWCHDMPWRLWNTFPTWEGWNSLLSMRFPKDSG